MLLGAFALAVTGTVLADTAATAAETVAANAAETVAANAAETGAATAAETGAANAAGTGAARAAGTIVDNVRGYTLNEEGRLIRFTYLRIDDDGRVAEVGRGTPPDADQRIDGSGHVLLPGLVDSGAHVLDLGLKHTRLDLAAAQTRDEVLSLVREYHRTHPHQGWIVGYGWNPDAIKLDDVVYVLELDAESRPTVLFSDDGLVAWVNTPAVAQTHLPSTGAAQLVTGASLERLRRAIPPPTDAQRDRALSEAFSELASLGYTTVHDVGASLATVQAYEKRAQDDTLPLRVYVSLDGLEALQAFRAGKRKEATSDRLFIGGVAFAVDGQLEDRTAMLLEDYADDLGYRGPKPVTEAELAKRIRTVRAAGMRVHARAVGDAAVTATLNAFATAGATQAERHQIEQATLVDPDDIEFFKRLGIIVAVTPEQARRGERIAHDRLSGLQQERLFPWRALIDAGAKVVMETGLPASDGSPFLSWHIASTEPHPLTLRQAFRASSADGAFALGLDDRIGTLEEGKWADFILVDRDPFDNTVPSPRNTVVLSTWVAGERTWHLPEFDTEPPMPIAPNIELSQPFTTEVPLEPPTVPTTSVPEEGSGETPMHPFRILGAEVPPRTSTRLTWSPGEFIEMISGSTPVLVVNGSRPGPVLCLTGAIHGDELNGIEIVRRVLYGLEADDLSGTVIGVPIVNVQGFRRASRYLVDRRDLNRYFPGDPNGSSAARIAYSLFTEVIEHCQAVVDLHTGSFQRVNLPQLRADLSNPSVSELALGFDEMVIMHSVGTVGTLRRAAVDAGIPAVTMETGGPMQLQEEAVASGVRGVRALLNNMGMYTRARLWGNTQRIYRTSTWVRADRGGVMLSNVRLGVHVSAGDVLATITDPITNVSSEIIAPHEGRVLGMAVNQIVMPGFATFRLGIESDGDDFTGALGEADEVEGDH